jgi:hypothetical protein
MFIYKWDKIIITHFFYLKQKWAVFSILVSTTGEAENK